MTAVAAAIVCKTPLPGQSKTRLSPPLRPDECAAISSCFIRDVAQTVESLTHQGNVIGYAVYAPIGSEAVLRRLLPDSFRLMPQCDGDLGQRLLLGAIQLFEAGHDGVVFINSDSPTLPASILHAAVDALRQGNDVVLSPAYDGGYSLIGLSKVHFGLFDGIPWSTSAVYNVTLERASEIGLPVVNVPGWYDVDDAASLEILQREMAGHQPHFSAVAGAAAPATRDFLRRRQTTAAA
jgi:hypothetical protein